MGDRADSAHIGLRHYVHVLQRRALPAAVVTLIVVAGSLLFSLRTTPVYAASADLLVNPTSPSLFSETGTLSGDRRTDLNTQVELIQSPAIRQAVLDALGPAGRKVGSMSATPVGQTTVVRLTVESTDARLAKRAVDTYASTYIATRQRQQNDTLQSAGAQVQKKLADIERQLGALDAQAPAAGPGAKSDVNAQRLTLQSQYTLYKQKLDQLQIDASLKDAGVQVASTASTPTTPIRPRHLRDALLATFIGLLMGVGVAFVFEYLDDRIRSAEDVTRYGEGLTTLAEIPSVQGWRDRSMTKVVTLETPEAPAAEAYWSLRTSVQLIGIRDPLRSLLVTSSIAGEGKSTTVANLGVAMARTGMRVALVDLDLRNPRLAEFFGFDNRLGLTSVLVGEATLERALHPVRVIDGAPPMMVLGSGVVPKNPSEVLGTARVGELLTLLQSKADIVIIDSPPLVPVTDGLVLANRVDGVLLVVGAGRARRQQVGRAVKLLHQAHALTIGAVLSSVKQRQPGYGYGYGYGYGVAEEAAAVLDPDAPLRGRVQAPQEPPAAFPAPSTGSNGGGRRSGVPGT